MSHLLRRIACFFENHDWEFYRMFMDGRVYSGKCKVCSKLGLFRIGV